VVYGSGHKVLCDKCVLLPGVTDRIRFQDHCFGTRAKKIILHFL